MEERSLSSSRDAKQCFVACEDGRAVTFVFSWCETMSRGARCLFRLPATELPALRNGIDFSFAVEQTISRWVKAQHFPQVSKRMPNNGAIIPTTTHAIEKFSLSGKPNHCG
jgi:hypothetical protein